MRLLILGALLTVSSPALSAPMDLAEQKTDAALTCMALAGQAGRLDEMDRLFTYAKQQLHSVWPQEQAQLRAMSYGPHYLTQATEDYMLGSLAGSMMAAVDQTLSEGKSNTRTTAAAEFDRAHCATVGK
jgi:hypothetical protein